MKKKNVLLIGLILSVLLFINACGEKPIVPSGEATSETEKNEGNTVISEPAHPTPEDAPQPQPDSEPDNDQTPAAEPPQNTEPAAKEYYMNRNYMIKPIAEDGQKNVVLLTFDDGPKEKELLNKILSTLKKHDAKAIFFVNGYRVKQNPDLLKEIHEAGQVIGNHSWDHIDLSKQNEEAVKDQLSRVQQIIEELTGSKPQFFRPPFGASNERVRQIVQDEGMLFMTWSNGSEDWVKQYQTPEGVIKRVMEQLHPGSNILMHELPWTAEGLDELLTRISAAGYSFLDPNAIDITYKK
jgi:peptidoglycan/xylan/chitin deacetylase (PgdA/CDA1 family)